MSKERYLQHQSGIFKQVKYMDLTKRFPYGDNTLRCAFSSHVLEHLYFDQAKKCLAEVYRVLVPGGILRISVPDLDKYIREYDPASANAFALAIFQSLESIDKNRHHWMYNEASLRELLQDIGFAKVSRQAYKTGDCPDVEIIDNRADSLFMEAIK